MRYLDPIVTTLNRFVTEFMADIPNIIIAIGLLFVIHLTSRLMGYLLINSLKRTRMRYNLIQVLHKITSILVWFFGILVISSILFPSITPAHIIGALGLTSVAIGLAFKEIFENFLAGILILLREPFHVGDFIASNGQQGYVEYVSVRNTHLRQTDGTRVVMPNGILFKEPIQVLTNPPLRRVMVTCSLDFDVDHNKAREVITQAIRGCETVSREKYIQVYLTSFSSNGLDFEIYWWSASKPGDQRRSRDEVLSSIKTALDAEKIRLTYSTPLSFCETLKVRNIDVKPDKKVSQNTEVSQD